MNSKLESREDFGRFLNNLHLNQYGVELGVAQGYFSESLLENSNLKILFSIDRWTDHHDYDEYLVAKEKLSKYNERSVILKLKFKDAVKLFDDEIFDFIYIDASHNPEDVIFDGINAFRHLKTGGIIIFDDYFWGKCRVGIDCFIETHKGYLNSHLDKFTQYQMIVEKTKDLS